MTAVSCVCQSLGWPIGHIGFPDEVRAVRRGLLLRREMGGGATLLWTSLPQTGRGQSPAGPGVYVSRRQFAQVQLPLLDDPRYT
ncbi:MAG: hypothetical protein LBV00_01625 [Propionibacteriaceae bacterium]|nr:hypothetical protein [Propionibacteriaceae bacterium]